MSVLHSIRNRSWVRLIRGYDLSRLARSARGARHRHAGGRPGAFAAANEQALRLVAWTCIAIHPHPPRWRSMSIVKDLVGRFCRTLLLARSSSPVRLSVEAQGLTAFGPAVAPSQGLPATGPPGYHRMLLPGSAASSVP